MMIDEVMTCGKMEVVNEGGGDWGLGLRTKRIQAILYLEI